MELGGAWIHGPTNNPLSKLADTYGNLVRSLTSDVQSIDASELVSCVMSSVVSQIALLCVLRPEGLLNLDLIHLFLAFHDKLSSIASRTASRHHRR
jgi:hypothetical protein